MNVTATVIWLLVSFASDYRGIAAPTVVQRFYSKEQCERVSKFLNDNKQGIRANAPTTACIDVKVNELSN